MKAIMFQVFFAVSIQLCFANSQTEWTNPIIDIKISDEITRPSLFLLSIGATPPDIRYTEEDANDVHNMIINQNRPNGLYKEVVTEKLIEAEATAGNILKKIGNMVWGRDITPNDVFILFISSHAYRFEGDVRIQATGFINAPNSASEKTSVSLKEILELLDQLEAKKLIFLDACYSGNLENDIYGSDLKGTKKSYQNKVRKKNKATSIEEDIRRLLNTKPGYTAITASSGTEESYWHEAWKNGAFTEVLMEGLNGKADKTNKQGIKDHVITIREICDYLEWRVPELCREQGIATPQHPSRIKHDLGDDFPFFIVDEFYKEDAKKIAKVVPLYGIKTRINPFTKEKKWEHISDMLFYGELENGARYLTGKVNFMGIDGTLGLRVNIMIDGDAFYQFGPVIKGTHLVIYLKNGKSVVLYNRQYYCQYDESTEQTEYVLAFDTSIENERALYKSKVKGVEIGWVVGKGQYKSAQPDALIKQLNDIKQAKENGIIKKRRRNRKHQNPFKM